MITIEGPAGMVSRDCPSMLVVDLYFYCPVLLYLLRVLLRAHFTIDR